jgi:hypothetical protein
VLRRTCWKYEMMNIEYGMYPMDEMENKLLIKLKHIPLL